MDTHEATILVVDDNPTNRKLLSSILQAEGYSTVEASDGEDALSVLQLRKIDAIITDILMPRMDGFRLCYEVRKSQSFARTPIIVLTSTYTSPGDEKLAFEVGADKLLTRPAPSADILSAVHTVLSQPEFKAKRTSPRPKEIEVIKAYSDALVVKLEEKNAELQKTSEELRVSEELFRIITENAADLIAVLDLHGRRLYSSPSYRLLVPDPAQLSGTDFFLDIHEHDRETFKRIVLGVITQGNARRAEYRIVLPGSKISHLESQVSLVRENDGSPAKIVIVSRDVTERKQAERALRDSEQRYRLLFQSNPHPMWFFDAETLAFLDVNDSAIAHYGYSRDEFLSMNITNIRPPEDVHLLHKDLAQGHTGIDVAGVWRHVKKDGTVIFVEITSQELDYSGRRAKVVLAHDITRRLEVERELRKLSSALEQTADNILITDTKGVIEYANPAFEESTGYEKQFAIGKTPSFLKSGRMSAEFYELLWETIRSGNVFRGEFVNRKRDGQLYAEQQTISPVFDADGKISHFVGAGRDITEQRRMEQAVAESEQRFRELTETIKEVFWLTDPEKRELLYISRGFEDTWGIKRDTLANNPGFWEKSIHPDDYSRVVPESLEKQINGQYDVEYRIVRPDSTIRWIHDKAFPVRDTSGKVIRIAGVAEDITERKQAEDDLVRSEEKFRSLFEESKDGLFISTVSGELIDVNPAALKMFGYDSKEEMLGVNIPRDLYLDESDRENLLVRLSREGAVEDFETVVKRKDGQRRDVILSATAVRDQQGKLSTIRGFIHDVTRQRQLEQQLFQSQKMESLGTLAGGIAHDFNNILGIVIGHATLLEAIETSSPRISKSVEAITKSAHRGASLVRQLLTFARKTDTTFESVMINEVVKEIEKLLVETLPRIIAVSVNLKPNLPSVVGDMTQLHQVLLNLCVNARDAMLPAGGTLTISTRLVDNHTARSRFASAPALEYVELSVADTGMGMDEATRSRIFEPFFTTKERGKGTGLGLATVYGIVETHNGFIDVESEPGRGTTFNLYFPVAQRQLNTPGNGEGVDMEALRGTETILLVEDEEMLREPVMDFLTDLGYTIIPASDGHEAIDKFSAGIGRIALIITDLGLPKLQGEALIKALRQISPTVKIIVSSGHIDSEQKSELRAVGVVDFMNKPFHPRELLEKIRKALASS